MLVGTKISLRSLIYSDLDFLEKIENDTSLWEFGTEQIRYTRKELKSYIKNSGTDLQIAKQFRFVVDHKSNPVGFIDLFNYKGEEVSIGIIIDEGYQNRGFAKESVSLLSNYCFDNLNIKKLNCSVDVLNKKSNALFLSLGFQLVRNEENHNFYIFVR